MDSDLEIVELPVPEPGPAEVQIEVRAAGVNRADLLQAAGHYPVPEGANRILGLEAAGHISAVGPGVDASLIGRGVAALLDGGGYAEYVTVPVTQIRLLPDDADLTLAAARPEALCTAWLNLVQLGNLQRGETVLVHGGSGGVGHVAIQMAHAMGATVLTTCGSEEKARWCEELGAAVGIDYHGDVVGAVNGATGGRGVDVILDVLGAGGLQPNLEMLAHGGRITVIGLQKGRVGELDVNMLMGKRASITGSRLRQIGLREKAVVVSGATSFSDRVSAHVDATVPFEDARRAHELMDAPETRGKIVLTL